MRHSRLDVARRALRARICTQCTDRPEGSESMPPTEARSCEPTCTVFVNLRKLVGIASRVTNPTIAPYQRAVQELVCQNCDAIPSAGDFCADRATRHCPLSRYLGEVVETLESVPK